MNRFENPNILHRRNKLNRLKITIGYLMMVIGISIPLTSFTMISINQIDSRSRYCDYLNENKHILYDKEFEKGIELYNMEIKKNTTNIIDPFIAESYETEYGFLKNDDNKVFAYLVIPSIKIAKPIRLGATYNHLANGVAQIDGTSLPIGGLGNRSVIAGHRGWYGDTMLFHLDELKVGDKVYIDRHGQVLTYSVKNREIISPSQWDKLKPDAYSDILTLLTCHPKSPPSPFRMLINCERVGVMQKENNKLNNDKKIGSSEILAKYEMGGNRVKKAYYIIYSVTIFGWLSLLFVINKFIRSCFTSSS